MSGCLIGVSCDAFRCVWSFSVTYSVWSLVDLIICAALPSDLEHFMMDPTGQWNHQYNPQLYGRLPTGAPSLPANTRFDLPLLDQSSLVASGLFPI